MLECIKLVSERTESGMGKKPIDSHLDVEHEPDRRLQLLEEEVQMVKVEMQRGFGLVHESLPQMPIMEKGLYAVIVKLDQILSQREGSTNAGLSMSRGKQVVEEELGEVSNRTGSGLESKVTEAL